jgi:signal recognition particle subunit SEC65
LPRSICVPSPKLDELSEAARRLQLAATAVTHAARPSRWWESEGYIIVEKRGIGKTALLLELSRGIRKLREERGQATQRRPVR